MPTSQGEIGGAMKTMPSVESALLAWWYLPD